MDSFYPASPRLLAGLSLRDLEYAQAVAELRHFGRAAERCGVSQPALSEQIRKLEAILGVTLFERTKRRVAPTAAGAALLVQAERVLAEARHLLALSHGQPTGMTGQVSLGAIETLGPYYLPGLLRLLRAERPELSLRLTEARTARLIERLIEGALDLLLLAMPVSRAGLTAAPLFFEPFLLATPPGHALAGLRRLTLDDLPADDLLLLEDGHCLRDQALSLCNAKPVTRHATSLETLWQMIAAGEGYSLLPALAVAARPELSDLVVCQDLGDASAGRTIALVWRASDPRDPLFRALAALLAGMRPAPTLAAVGG
ncbi:LysR family transcriptional regulator [Acidiphilium sp. AL]|uniref:LysR substrate-binding domain-containing protein n=1 Tax=Acidiphilium iwatense TaxID=768198 RepID=A0ABS9DTG5_9PROT|nr:MULTISPECIES: LysR substrate-binding domain-containing protein [Acidiphilium]MCF3946028.1 LysR substrate-binding domain-containing protein [Acidiphilium iwatense]MCU4159091.1 LysR family transcriptional regulator [Acidiphilium sp. AL]